MADLSSEARAALRGLPRVDDLLAAEGVVDALGDAPRSLATGALRATLDAERARILGGETPRSREELVDACAAAVGRAVLPHLRCAVNATGVVVHTNLGRAPVSPHVAAHIADVASHYDTLEFDVSTCKRGSRHDHVRELLCELTGAQDAAVVNNNAAAVMLVLSELARGREVIVSRGELIEIGGSFRIPDIMALSGAKMVEVGTTNKTHLSDFERAITPETALVLKVHPSNYRVVGFHEEADVVSLAHLAHDHGIRVYEDQGSGVLVNLEQAGIPSDEYTPGWSLAQGVDVVTCSGDKLLGASQAGIILGSAELVGRIKKHPMMRALRPDKLTLAGLEATLRDYLDDGAAWDRIPVLSMLRARPEQLRVRAYDLLARLAALLGVPVEGTGGAEATAACGVAARAGEGDSCEGADGAQGPSLRMGPVVVRAAADVSFVGGGALPTTELPSWTLRLSAPGADLEALRARLIQQPARPVVTRVSHDELVCDVRTLVDARDEDDLLAALAGEVRFLATKEGEDSHE